MAKKEESKKPEAAKEPPKEIKDLLTRKSAEGALVARAWKDEAFKKELLKSPKATLEKTLGLKLPKNAKVTIHEEKPGEFHYVLPVAPSTSGELSDAELESVAGGGKGQLLQPNATGSACAGDAVNKAGDAAMLFARAVGWSMIWNTF